MTTKFCNNCQPVNSVIESETTGKQTDRLVDIQIANEMFHMDKIKELTTIIVADFQLEPDGRRFSEKLTW